jgi:release factor glutamine methyltransferase
MDKLIDILEKSKKYLEDNKVKNSRIETELILSQVLGLDRIMLYAYFDRILKENEISEIRSLLKSKVNSEETENKSNEMNMKTLMDQSIKYMENHHIEEARLTVELIFSHVLSIDRMMLFTKYSMQPEEEKKDKIRTLLKLRAKDKIPLQYLLNEEEFYGRAFYINKGVLIPRNETEIVVEKALHELKNTVSPNILDIGAGSGVISITIGKEKPDSRILGVDISDNALEIANKNKLLLKAENVKFIKSNLFQEVNYHDFDMIISNPPYIPKSEYDTLNDDVRIHEPEEALIAENEGLFFYYEISRCSVDYLKNGGKLIFECGYNQAEIIENIMKEAGYKNIEIFKDLNGINRGLAGTLSKE